MTDDTSLPFAFSSRPSQETHRRVQRRPDHLGRWRDTAGEAGRRLGIAAKLAAAIPDGRDASRVTHTLPDILRARIFAIACGWESADDLESLRFDPAFKLACGRLPDSRRDLCSQPTMSAVVVERLPAAVKELLPAATAEKNRIYYRGKPFPWDLGADGTWTDATEEEVNDVRRRRRAEAAAKYKAKVDVAGEAEAIKAPETEELERYAEDDSQAALLDVFKDMKAKAFERLARLLLLGLNFSQVEVVGRSGDGGIDLLGIVRLNKVLSFRVLVQCKRYKDTVGPGEIRNFRGAMQGRTDKGIFITSGRYTREARHEASREGVPAVDLIDGEGLCELLKGLGLGVETRMVERVTIKPEFFEGV